MYGDISPQKLDRVEVFKVHYPLVQIFLLRSEGFLCFNAHFRFRTRFCTGETCPWCANGLLRRWRGFVAAVKPPKTPGLLELSAEAFDEWRKIKEAQELSGTIVEVSRRSKTAPAIPTVISPTTEISWPVLSIPQMLDQVCHLLSIPARSQYSGDDGWRFAVEACYQQELDSKLVLRLAQ